MCSHDRVLSWVWLGWVIHDCEASDCFLVVWQTRSNSVQWPCPLIECKFVIVSKTTSHLGEGRISAGSQDRNRFCANCRQPLPYRISHYGV